MNSSAHATVIPRHTLVGPVVQWGAVLVIAMLVILALNIQSRNGAPSWTDNMPQTVALGAPQAGSTTTLRMGDTLEISLAGNPTTGYNWSVAAMDPAVLQAAGAPEFQASSSALGAGGTVISRFTAVGSGQTTLTLNYARPFEKGVAPLQTYAVTVVVPEPVPGSYP